MKETAILFSGAMPQAAMSGRKTITRRIIKPQPHQTHWDKLDGYKLLLSGPHNMSCGRLGVRFQHYIPQNRVGDTPTWAMCPYGKPGDRLRFLGTWAVAREYDRVKPSLLPLDVRIWSVYSGEPKPDWCGKSRPGRFMPKWMRSQMPLAEITGIRVERLHDISEEDAKAEGVASLDYWPNSWKDYLDDCGWCGTAKTSFITLWESINGSGSWDANPWVWVVEFRRVKP